MLGVVLGLPPVFLNTYTDLLILGRKVTHYNSHDSTTKRHSTKVGFDNPTLFFSFPLSSLSSLFSFQIRGLLSRLIRKNGFETLQMDNRDVLSLWDLMDQYKRV